MSVFFYENTHLSFLMIILAMERDVLCLSVLGKCVCVFMCLFFMCLNVCECVFVSNVHE